MEKKRHRFDVHVEVKMDGHKVSEETWWVWAENGLEAEVAAKNEGDYRGGEYSAGSPGERRIEYIVTSVLPSTERPAGWYKSLS